MAKQEKTKSASPKKKKLTIQYNSTNKTKEINNENA
jgi:hypothetical protein